MRIHICIYIYMYIYIYCTCLIHFFFKAYPSSFVLRIARLISRSYSSLMIPPAARMTLSSDFSHASTSAFRLAGNLRAILDWRMPSRRILSSQLFLWRETIIFFSCFPSSSCFNKVKQSEKKHQRSITNQTNPQKSTPESTKIHKKSTKIHTTIHQELPTLAVGQHCLSFKSPPGRRILVPLRSGRTGTDGDMYMVNDG